LIGRVVDCWLNQVKRSSQQNQIDLIFQSVAQTLQSYGRFHPRRVRAFLKGMKRHRKQGVRGLLIEEIKQIQRADAEQASQDKAEQRRSRALRAAHPQKKEKDPVEDLSF